MSFVSSRRLQRAVTIATVVACLVVASACASAGSRPSATTAAAISVGVAEIDITPDQPIRLTGYGNRVEPAGEVRQRLSARAIAFGEGRGTALLITVDLIGVSRTITDDLAQRLSDTGVTRASL